MFALALVLASLILPSSARVTWIPEEFDPLVGRAPLLERDVTLCGGNSNLTSCGSSFPSSFCCPLTSKCLALNTSTAITAIICCPEGNDCSTINTISCDQRVQNATLVPSSDLHSDPTQQLATCGDACCPMGYTCQSGSCKLVTTSALTSTASSSTASRISSSTLPTSSAATTTSAPITTGQSIPVDGGSPTASSVSRTSFNSKSFAAGFLPGIAIGAFLAACIILLVMRNRRHSSRDSHLHEKYSNRDTLSSLSADPYPRRPAAVAHGRSISEPTIDPASSSGYRTDFLRGTPPRMADPTTQTPSYQVDIRSPASLTPRPAHLKSLTGAFSFNTISPIRALKKQKSLHSLRRHRQMHDLSRASSGSGRTRRASTNSTETIQVLMPRSETYTTPQQNPTNPSPPSANVPASRAGTATAPLIPATTYQAPDSGRTWLTMTDTGGDHASNAGLSSPVAQQQMQQVYTSPPRAALPANSVRNVLGSPYTPTRQQSHSGAKGKGRAVRLSPPSALERIDSDSDSSDDVYDERGSADDKRGTKFSTMMERAGLRRSAFLAR